MSFSFLDEEQPVWAVRLECYWDGRCFTEEYFGLTMAEVNDLESQDHVLRVELFAREDVGVGEYSTYNVNWRKL